MMTEISLNILDIAQNSIRAEASIIVIDVAINTIEDSLTIIISDNGKGMTKEQVEKSTDPFFTTRNTRKVGLGLPFFKMAAEGSNGDFFIESQVGKGTKIKAVFKLSHVDRMPLGDINSTIYTLIAFNTDIDFVFTYSYNDKKFSIDTREFRKNLDGVALNNPEVLKYLIEYLEENKNEVDSGIMI